MSKDTNTESIISRIENIRNGVEASIDLLYCYEENNQTNKFNKNIISILLGINSMADNLISDLEKGTEQ